MYLWVCGSVSGGAKKGGKGRGKKKGKKTGKGSMVAGGKDISYLSLDLSLRAICSVNSCLCWVRCWWYSRRRAR